MQNNTHPTWQVLQSGDVRFFIASRYFSAASLTLLRATIAWHVYALTQSAWHLGLIGVVQFLPVLPFSLLGGAVADTYNRRGVVLAAQGVTLLCSAVLWYVTDHQSVTLLVIYAMVLTLSVSAAFENPARASLLPMLVPRRLFPNAVVLHSTFQNLAWVTGPVLTGFAIDYSGIAMAYGLNIGLIAVSIAALFFVHPRAMAGQKRGVSLQAVAEGVRFVRSRSVVLASMVLDMFAVIFAGATALLPVFANEILQTGPRGYGVLSASLEAGTLTMAVILLVFPPLERPGRALLAAVAVYGAATILFGFSRYFPLSVAAVVMAGMADQVSMVTRSTIIQLSTPDALRGRVNSVNMIFVNASNQLGVAESGFLAAVTNATFSVVAGGVACLGVVGVVASKVTSLRDYRIEDDRAR